MTLAQGILISGIAWQVSHVTCSLGKFVRQNDMSNFESFSLNKHFPRHSHGFQGHACYPTGPALGGLHTRHMDKNADTNSRYARSVIDRLCSGDVGTRRFSQALSSCNARVRGPRTAKHDVVLVVEKVISSRCQRITSSTSRLEVYLCSEDTVTSAQSLRVSSKPNLSIPRHRPYFLSPLAICHLG